MGERSALPGERVDLRPDVPTYDFLQHRDVHGDRNLGWLVSDLILSLERGDFLRWEAVVCQELGLPLTERQRQAIGELLDFNDDPADERILYIDGIPRPDRLWYEIVRHIAPHLLVEQYRTAEVHYAVTTDGWKDWSPPWSSTERACRCPRGSEHPVEVVPAEMRHKLWLQTCLGHLGGLGQDEDLTLQDPDEHYRIEEFIPACGSTRRAWRRCDLTLEKMMTVLILPPQDEPIFLRMMQEQLGLASMQDRIAGRL